ncbi:MAG: site-specific DNA-methyltransferase [Firmicutes bacterium]|nr:site-specific DNA-methyltransferase [Bacillota bacterium]
MERWRLGEKMQTGRPPVSVDGEESFLPCPEESRHWHCTKNLYFEGDNLVVLRLLLASHANSIDMIYIDPPYNTGKDFIYNDSFRRSADWCQMMYPRLQLAHQLLTDTGVIFISIDDHELVNLRLMAHEIFGEQNFVAQICWKGRGGRQDSKHFAVVHEYILCYAKDASQFQAGQQVKQGDAYPKFDPVKRQYYKTRLLRKWGANSRRSDRPNLFYPILAPDNTPVYPMLSATEEGCWRWGQARMERELAAGNVEFVKTQDGYVAYEKVYAPPPGRVATKKFTTWIDDIGVGSGAPLLKKLFGTKVFDYPKPVELIKRLIQMGGVGPEGVILDFFSGSASTAHAVMELNGATGSRRSFIMVQWPEPTDEGSPAYVAGYTNISEIGKERIRRAGDLLKAKHPSAALDVGFRVYKLKKCPLMERDSLTSLSGPANI